MTMVNGLNEEENFTRAEFRYGKKGEVVVDHVNVDMVVVVDFSDVFPIHIIHHHTYTYHEFASARFPRCFESALV
ncbi:unnamed protein product [Lactuca virosa]|uniref:Uncharacterized protein n=1 Tax=Lactuca virosa TaxID=75947 RepID=A0AAU9NZJ4_9ASTR|nr:unnamed protein product [Lactuca virosa]